MLDRTELASKYGFVQEFSHMLVLHLRKCKICFHQHFFRGIAFVFLNRIDFSRCPNTICYGFKHVFVSPGLELLKEHREANVIKK